MKTLDFYFLPKSNTAHTDEPAPQLEPNLPTQSTAPASGPTTSSVSTLAEGEWSLVHIYCYAFTRANHAHLISLDVPPQEVQNESTHDRAPPSQSSAHSAADGSLDSSDAEQASSPPSTAFPGPSQQCTTVEKGKKKAALANQNTTVTSANRNVVLPAYTKLNNNASKALALTPHAQTTPSQNLEHSLSTESALNADTNSSTNSTLETFLFELDPSDYSDLIQPASIAVSLLTDTEPNSDNTPTDVSDSVNPSLKFTFSTSESAIKRRGKRTLGMRAKSEEKARKAVEFLKGLGEKACVRDDERQGIIENSQPGILLSSVIEHQRLRTSRAPPTSKSLAMLTSSTAVSAALQAYTTSPWTFNPGEFPDVFICVNDKDEVPLESTQQYYFRTFQYSVETLRKRIAAYSEDFRADADRFAVWTRRLAVLAKTDRVFLNYVGTTHASTPGGRHSSDQASAEYAYSRITNWIKLFPADAVTIWKLDPLTQHLKGPSDWSALQLHRQNHVAVDLEELLIDLGGDYLLNSAFGGTLSFKFSPSRMLPDERATETLVSLYPDSHTLLNMCIVDSG